MQCRERAIYTISYSTMTPAPQYPLMESELGHLKNIGPSPTPSNTGSTKMACNKSLAVLRGSAARGRTHWYTVELPKYRL